MSTAAQKLINKTRQQTLAQQVRVANNFWTRTKGLLGEKSLPAGNALWIQGSRWVGCNSIHTFFMQFAIDAVFVDRDMKVKAIYRNLGPWRVTSPALGAFSVFEMPAGTLDSFKVEVGDLLHVGD